MSLWKDYYTPTTVAEALQIRSRYGHDAEFVAGGTDLILDLQQGNHGPLQALVDVTSIEHLNEIRAENGCVVLGAGLMIHSRDRIEDVIVNVDPSLAEELRSVGYREASRPLQLGAVFAVLGAAIAGLAEAKRGTSS